MPEKPWFVELVKEGVRWLLSLTEPDPPEERVVYLEPEEYVAPH